MIHSKITPYIELESKKISILDAAEKTIGFYKKLSQVEPKFREIKLVSEIEPLFENIEIDKPNSVELLAKEILNQNIKEIRKNDDSEEFDINYANSNILSYALTSTYDNGDSILTLTFCFTMSKWLSSSIGSIVAHETYFSKARNCIYLLKSVIESFDVSYATIRPTNDREHTKYLKRYKHNSKLGIFTYYSNNLGFNIPTELQSGGIEEFNKGKLYILKEFAELDKPKQEIISFMKRFEIRDPTILKR
jgi:hypothetical protein